MTLGRTRKERATVDISEPSKMGKVLVARATQEPARSQAYAAMLRRWVAQDPELTAAQRTACAELADQIDAALEMRLDDLVPGLGG